MQNCVIVLKVWSSFSPDKNSHQLASTLCSPSIPANNSSSSTDLCMVCELYKCSNTICNHCTSFPHLAKCFQGSSMGFHALALHCFYWQVTWHCKDILHRCVCPSSIRNMVCFHFLTINCKWCCYKYSHVMFGYYFHYLEIISLFLYIYMYNYIYKSYRYLYIIYVYIWEELLDYMILQY